MSHDFLRVGSWFLALMMLVLPLLALILMYVDQKNGWFRSLLLFIMFLWVVIWLISLTYLGPYLR